MNLTDIMDEQLCNPTIPSIRPRLTAHPSAASIELSDGSIVGGCLRSEYYRITGEEPTERTTPMQQMKFRMGDKMHELVTEVLTEARIIDAIETDIWIPEYRIHGRIDAIVADDETDNKIGVEIKSVWGYHGKKLVIIPQRGVLEPKQDHVLQSLIYLDFFSQFGMELWKLFYIARDNGEYNEHTIKFEGEDKHACIKSGIGGTYIHYPDLKIQGIKDRFSKFWGYVNANELPPRDYVIQYNKEKLLALAEAGDLSKDDTAKAKEGRFVDKGDWRCRYCKYSSKCWDGYDGQKLWSGEEQ